MPPYRAPDLISSAPTLTGRLIWGNFSFITTTGRFPYFPSRFRGALRLVLPMAYSAWTLLRSQRAARFPRGTLPEAPIRRAIRLQAAAALGWNLSRGWDLTGPFACDLLWQEPPYPWTVAGASQPVGWVEFGGPSASPVTGSGGDSLRAPFLNRSVDQIKARAEWKPGSRHIALASAQAFGARWSGTFDRRDPSGEWQFALSADHLAAADLDRWLNPAWRESFLDRMLPFLNSRAQSTAAPENLRASGRLRLDQFELAPLDHSSFAGRSQN